ncbi:MAG: EAL domain-containing protein [Acidobacteriaceae bacterium]|nr:EAL domain-containing protein [Acidobacteriaceae bacterium]
MELLVKNYRRIQLIRWAGGICALSLLIHKVAQLGQASLTPTVANGFIWGTTFLTVILLLWRERNHAASNRRTSEENARFIAAAETSPDAFSILDSVRDEAGEIIGFHYKYVNSHSEKLWNKSRIQMLDKDMCEVSPTDCTRKLMKNYRKVVLTGEPFSENFRITLEDGSERWLRRRVIKLDDGVAVTVSDTTEIRATEDRYRNLSNLSNSVFETAPFSIIETDLNGMIRAMNHAAEKLTGYERSETVGKIPLTALHDANELSQQPDDARSQDDLAIDDFMRLTAQAATGEVEERDWTYIQRDGTTLPVHVAITAVRDGDGKISGFIAIASDISERRQLMTYLNHMASHDQLTGLPGRKMLRERISDAIERTIKNGRKVAVFVIDLDQFKRLNDTLGHRAGDEILVGMAERMQESLRRSDTLGRLGGDEFVVVMPHIANVADVERCAQRLVERISSTDRIGDRAVNLTASIGVCVYPDFADNVDNMLERADAATYAAKENGRNQYQIFADAMLKQSQERMSMDSALRHALEREEMFLHYQPLVSLATGRVVGMEALLRWHHPKLGLISPTTFIPLAEETGLIVPIGEWAMKQSCKEAKAICDELGMDLSVSINLSPRQFDQSNLLQVIGEALNESGLPAKSLQVELTERMLMVDSASNLKKLQQIRELGARIAIDDFGTGFCSFSYLLQYQVDCLKIDQSFIMKAVTEPNAATVVRAILSMSQHLGIKVTAEGVETTDHLKVLSKRNCDQAQGYYFSRPVSAAGFIAAVESIHRTLDERKLIENEHFEEVQLAG